MLVATASTYLRSAEPSSSGGVPTAINTTSPCLMPSSASVVNFTLPDSKFEVTSGVKPGSYIGMIPFSRLSTLFWSTSTHTTSWPTSANTAACTRPT